MTESSEYNREFSLLFLQEDESSEERWDEVVLALSKHLHHILLILCQLLCFLAFVELFFFTIISLLGGFIPEWFTIKDLISDFL
jgi:hypothetical protein